jgi:UDP-glucuronate 4-epimerase
MKILVTGSAGFIGYHVAERLLARGDEVVGLDNLNEYYDPALKRARLARLESQPGFRFEKIELADRAAMERLFAGSGIRRVVHLAAQAGVRYSIENPHAYADSNLTGTLHVLEGCRHHGVEHLVFASTSSVYGANTKMPFSVHQNVDHPLSFCGRPPKLNRPPSAERPAKNFFAKLSSTTKTCGAFGAASFASRKRPSSNVTLSVEK